MLRVSLVQRNKARRIMTWYARIFDTETKAIRYVSLGTTKKTEAYALMLEKQAEGAFSDIGTTLQIYSHVMEDDLRGDIEKMFL